MTLNEQLAKDYTKILDDLVNRGKENYNFNKGRLIGFKMALSVLGLDAWTPTEIINLKETEPDAFK